MPEFLDRLKKGIDRGVTTVAVRSKELLETTQLRGQLGRLQEERQRSLEELGSVVYTLTSQDRLQADLERVRAKCAAVTQIDTQIRATEDELRRVQTAASQAVGTSAGSVHCSCGPRRGVNDRRFCAGVVDEALLAPLMDLAH